ncbi:MAG: hypothetical protein EBR82_19165 [Caulobacteraceae bacterium]|nr:hypothetical protein [Caulobacteraceae bacterium]
MNSLLEKLFGANYRTTITGWLETLCWLLTFLAAAPYTLGEVANILPPEWKATVFKVSGIAAGLLAFLNRSLAKDKTITGNGTPNAPYEVPFSGDILQRNRVIPPKLPLIAIAAFATFGLTGCQTIPITARVTYGTSASIGYDGKTVAVEADASALLGFKK